MDTSLTRTFADGEVVQTPHLGEIARGSGYLCPRLVRARNADRPLFSANRGTTRVSRVHFA